MNFSETLKYSRLILSEGSVIERIKRNSEFELDPFIANAAFIYNDNKKNLLKTIYKDYVGIGQKFDLPFIVLTPTWRANKERLESSGFIDKDVNGDNFRFLSSIREEFGNYSNKIFIGGLIGCAGDAYNPDETLNVTEAKEFHSFQLKKLAEAGVDFFLASTLPAFS